MALPPQSFDDWLESPTCPNCEQTQAAIPDNQQLQCPCGVEYMVLVKKVEFSGKTGEVYWTMPVDEFFKNFEAMWQQLRDST